MTTSSTTSSSACIYVQINLHFDDVCVAMATRSNKSKGLNTTTFTNIILSCQDYLLLFNLCCENLHSASRLVDPDTVT
jgi:hypothetical protein